MFLRSKPRSSSCFQRRVRYRDEIKSLYSGFITHSVIWTVDELIAGVGSVGRSAALKALLTWIDLGVLKEDAEGTFRLLEIAEEPSADGSDYMRLGL